MPVPRLPLLALTLSLAACASDSEGSDAPLVAAATDPVAEDVLSETAANAALITTTTEEPDGTPYEALRGWIGHDPVREDGTHFVLDPSVRPTLEEAFSVEPGLMDRLSHLDEAPTFLAEPVDFVGGAYALAFAPSEGQDDPRSLWMVIEAETGAVYALLSDGGDTYYRASHDARIDDLRSEAIAWMEAQSGEPFAEIAQMSEAAPLSP